MDGTAEWTAVTMELPQESSDCQLACLLLCKGVQKSLVSCVYIIVTSHLDIYTV